MVRPRLIGHTVTRETPRQGENALSSSCKAAVVAEMRDGVPAEERHHITSRNAIRTYGRAAEQAATREPARVGR
jgi:hypothetical protein